MYEGNEPGKMTASSFACHIHAYLRQFIQAADQKAAFTLAASGAVLGFVITRLSDTDHPHSICFWALGTIGAVLLFFAGGMAAWSVWPRQNDLKTGLVAWGGILERTSSDEYINLNSEVEVGFI